jgi:hypothetical protein
VDNFPPRHAPGKIFIPLALASLFVVGSIGLRAQQEQEMIGPHTYMRAGIVEHHGATATVKADHARPLEQAMRAVSQEYGWNVYYEDAPYRGKYDVADMVNPSYRATHHDVKSVPGPAGGPFQSTYPEPTNTSTSQTQEEQILNKIVSDYNGSSNPGHFVVRRLTDDTFDVVGDGIHDDNGAVVPVTPVLDTVVSIPLETRSFGGKIHAIMDAVSAKVGVKLGGVASMPGNGLLGAAVSFGSPNPAPARDVLMQLIAGHKFQMTLLYEPQLDPKRYAIVFLRVPAAKFKDSR